MRVENKTDRVYWPSTTLSDGRRRVLELPLPFGAIPIELNDARFHWDQETYKVIDTLGVLPNEAHTMRILALLPPAERWEVRYELPHPITNRPELMLVPGHFRVESAQYQLQGTMQFTGGVFEDYLAQPLVAGETIAYTLRPIQAGEWNPQIVFGVGFVAVGLGSLGVVGWFTLRQRLRKPRTEAELIAEIAALDQAYQQQTITEQNYQRRRAALKRQLAKLLKSLP